MRTARCPRQLRPGVQTLSSTQAPILCRHYYSNVIRIAKPCAEAYPNLNSRPSSLSSRLFPLTSALDLQAAFGIVPFSAHPLWDFVPFRRSLRHPFLLRPRPLYPASLPTRLLERLLRSSLLFLSFYCLISEPLKSLLFALRSRRLILHLLLRPLLASLPLRQSLPSPSPELSLILP